MCWIQLGTPPVTSLKPKLDESYTWQTLPHGKPYLITQKFPLNSKLVSQPSWDPYLTPPSLITYLPPTSTFPDHLLPCVHITRSLPTTLINLFLLLTFILHHPLLNLCSNSSSYFPCRNPLSVSELLTISFLHPISHTHLNTLVLVPIGEKWPNSALFNLPCSMTLMLFSVLLF
jgi:hypothetical protein